MTQEEKRCLSKRKWLRLGIESLRGWDWKGYSKKITVRIWRRGWVTEKCNQESHKRKWKFEIIACKSESQRFFKLEWILQKYARRYWHA